MVGVTFLDGELADSATAANRGNEPVGVPDVQASLWAEWDTPWLEGFTLTGGAMVGCRLVWCFLARLPADPATVGHRRFLMGEGITVC
jgi:hypothetical protein